jgi:hypothetical protein
VAGDIADFVVLRPDQLGWLRRPELDIGTGKMWELPSGEVYLYAGPGDLVLYRRDGE